MLALRVPATPTESGTATPTEDALLVPPQVGHRGSPWQVMLDGGFLSHGGNVYLYILYILCILCMYIYIYTCTPK